MQTIIISTVIALALWAASAKLLKFTHEQVTILLENKAERKRFEERAIAKKERQDYIMVMSNQLCRENEYLTKLVYYFRSLPQQKKKNRSSPTWILTENLRAQIESQIRRSLGPTNHNYYNEVLNHLIGKFK